MPFKRKHLKTHPCSKQLLLYLKPIVFSPDLCGPGFHTKREQDHILFIPFFVSWGSLVTLVLKTLHSPRFRGFLFSNQKLNRYRYVHCQLRLKSILYEFLGTEITWSEMFVRLENSLMETKESKTTGTEVNYLTHYTGLLHINKNCYNSPSKIRDWSGIF